MGQATVAANVEDHVVAVLAVGEILAAVVDDVIGAEGSHHIDLRCAAHTGDVGSERLGDLHSEVAHSSRGTDDQHRLTGLDPSVVAHCLEGGEPRDRHGSRRIKGKIRRLQCELVSSNAYILCE